MPSRSGTTSSRSRRAEPARETPAIERFGRIDVLVTLIGGSRGNPGIEAGNDDWDAVLAANLRSAVTMTRLVIPSMKERRSGVIVHVASIFGREWGGAASYNASRSRSSSKESCPSDGSAGPKRWRRPSSFSHPRRRRS